MSKLSQDAWGAWRGDNCWGRCVSRSGPATQAAQNRRDHVLLQRVVEVERIDANTLRPWTSQAQGFCHGATVSDRTQPCGQQRSWHQVRRPEAPDARDGMSTVGKRAGKSG